MSATIRFGTPSEINTKEPNSVKLSIKWEGSYRITEIVGKGGYRLQALDGRDIPRSWNAGILALRWRLIKDARTLRRVKASTDFPSSSSSAIFFFVTPSSALWASTSLLPLDPSWMLDLRPPSALPGTPLSHVWQPQDG
ncbi:hypothetical protein L6452_01743 [Arctium lappa]|uniref:Uncharacterized protein n=1 Tax=Arctium lappa TaxID=4217 RepID=A0ACB9FGY5_ARCLA|nr:hypothetical protein L6452_01743 [Arctium lappa]